MHTEERGVQTYFPTGSLLPQVARVIKDKITIYPGARAYMPVGKAKIQASCDTKFKDFN